MHYKIAVFLCYFLQAQAVMAFSPVCSAILKPETIYENVKRAVNGHLLSSDLTQEQRAYIDYLASRIENRVNEFDRAYNRVLAPYGTEFLPRLREKLERMSSQFRQKNWQIINELRRYLNDGSLKYRDLNISRAADFLKSSAANRFIHNRYKVYFGLDFFVSTIDVEYSLTWAGLANKREIVKRDGYQILTPLISRELGYEVRTLEENNTGDVYPGTQIPSLPSLEADGLPFSGFPLTTEFLEFLKNKGDQQGHINIAALPVLEENPSIFNQLGIVARTRQTSLGRVSQYDYDSSNYFTLKTEDHLDYMGFYDEAGYEFDQYGVLLIPGVRVNLKKVSVIRRILPTAPRHAELFVNDQGDLSTYPNRYEFFIALVSKAHSGE